MAAQLSGPSGGSRFDLGQNADINVTPFVDVMLVLLIVMMVSAPLATVSIKVDLPPAPPGLKATTKPTFISIQKDGKIYLTGESPSITGLDRLAADLQAKLGVPDAHTETILIRADRDVPYDKFMQVVNQLQTDSFYKVGLIVEDAPIGEL